MGQPEVAEQRCCCWWHMKVGRRCWGPHEHSGLGQTDQWVHQGEPGWRRPMPEVIGYHCPVLAGPPQGFWCCWTCRHTESSSHFSSDSKSLTRFHWSSFFTSFLSGILFDIYFSYFVMLSNLSIICLRASPAFPLWEMRFFSSAGS